MGTLPVRKKQSMSDARGFTKKRMPVRMSPRKKTRRVMRAERLEIA